MSNIISLKDFVRAIGESNTYAQECQLIRTQLRQLLEHRQTYGTSSLINRENLLMILFIDMLGHDITQFHNLAIEAIGCKFFHIKRIGYLLCCQVLPLHSPLRITTINSILTDLNSQDIKYNIIALQSITSLVTVETAPIFIPKVLSKLQADSSMVRRHAVIVFQKLYFLTQDEKLLSKMTIILCDRDPSVMAVILPSIERILANNSEHTFNKVPMTSMLLAIYNQILDNRLKKSFELFSIPAPFIQLQIIRILAILGGNDIQQEEQIGPILKRGLDAVIIIKKHLALAIVIEIIHALSLMNQLDSQVYQIVSKMMESVITVVKYAGLCCLVDMGAINHTLILSHQSQILECLEHTDITIALKAIELILKLCNSSNVQSIASTVLNFIQDRIYRPYTRLKLLLILVTNAQKTMPSPSLFIKLVFDCLRLDIANEGVLLSDIHTTTFLPIANMLITYLHVIEDDLSRNEAWKYAVKTSMDTLSSDTHVVTLLQTAIRILTDDHVQCIKDDEFSLGDLLAQLNKVLAEWKHEGLLQCVLTALARLLANYQDVMATHDLQATVQSIIHSKTQFSSKLSIQKLCISVLHGVTDKLQGRSEEYVTELRETISGILSQLEPEQQIIIPDIVEKKEDIKTPIVEATGLKFEPYTNLKSSKPSTSRREGDGAESAAESWSLAQELRDNFNEGSFSTFFSSINETAEASESKEDDLLHINDFEMKAQTNEAGSSISEGREESSLARTSTSAVQSALFAGLEPKT